MKVIIHDIQLFEGCLHHFTGKRDPLYIMDMYFSQWLLCKEVSGGIPFDISSAINNGILKEYHFSPDEVDLIDEIYEKYSDKITFTQASTIYLGKSVEDCKIITKCPVMKGICKEIGVEIYDFDEFIMDII